MPEPALSDEFDKIDRLRSLPMQGFFSDYVDKRPVVIEGLAGDWAALSRWNSRYFRDRLGEVTVRVKPGYLPHGRVAYLPLRGYLDQVEEFEERLGRHEVSPEERPPYLHDIPMLTMAPWLVDDVTPFPEQYIPYWYRSQWWKFSQFFMGPSHSLTPLHFDSLETHNIFFQIVGRKRFIIVPPEDRRYCYLYDWRWSPVDVENPDLEKHPGFRRARCMECIVGPGDVLYMPPGTLHHVRSLDLGISFNIDWQTRSTAIRGAMRVLQGMPAKNAYYNMVVALGLWTGLPSKLLFPFYKTYLNYVS